MKINLKNDAKVEAALAEANGRAASFAVTLASEARELAAMAEQKLADAGLPKAQRKGTVAVCTPDLYAANGYKYNAHTTKLELVRGASGWFLTSAERWTRRPGRQAHAIIEVHLTDDQAREVQRRALEPFQVSRTFEPKAKVEAIRAMQDRLTEAGKIEAAQLLDNGARPITPPFVLAEQLEAWADRLSTSWRAAAVIAGMKAVAEDLRAG